MKDWRSKPRIKNRKYAEPMKKGFGINCTDEQLKQLRDRAEADKFESLSDYVRWYLFEREKHDDQTTTRKT